MHHAIAYLLPLSACLLAFVVWFVFRLPIHLIGDPVRAIKKVRPDLPSNQDGLKGIWRISYNAGILITVAYSLGLRTEWPEEFRKNVNRFFIIRCCAFVCPLEPIVKRVIPFWFGGPYFAITAVDAYGDLRAWVNCEIEFADRNPLRDQLLEFCNAYR